MRSKPPSGRKNLAYVAQTDRQTKLVTGAAATAPIVLLLFVLSLLPPTYFFVNDLRLSPTRVLLLIMFLPLLFKLITGAAGRIRAFDVLLILFMVWMVVTLLYHHGMARFPYAMISAVELFGGYLIGRVLVRNSRDFELLFRYLFWALVVLSPFVLLEMLTNRNLLQELSREILPTYFKGDSSRGRLGLYRVMAGFEHPILYGVFCAAVFSPILAVLGRRRWAWAALALFLGLMTFASLSSAPLLALVIQIGLISWALIMRGRWWLLFGLVATAYVVVDLLSNRTPITILINYITFDPATAWTRVITWQFGSAEMWRHPIFGIGLNDWERPYWLTASVDNFWLLIGMRHGVVGVLLLIIALGYCLWCVMRTEGLQGKTALMRRNYAFALIATYIALCTVHIWGSSSSFIMLLIGAGAWFIDAPRGETSLDTGPLAKTGGPRPYSRFSGHVLQRSSAQRLS
jgi:hypothetical protein